jgi:hypothetical protein
MKNENNKYRGHEQYPIQQFKRKAQKQGNKTYKTHTPYTKIIKTQQSKFKI